MSAALDGGCGDSAAVVAAAADAARARYTALAVLRQLTAGGNAWGAETLLMHAPGAAFRPALLLLRAGDEAGVVARMREMLTA